MYSNSFHPKGTYFTVLAALTIPVAAQTLERVPPKTHLPRSHDMATGCLLHDFQNDGAAELFVGAMGQNLQIWRNFGDGRFESSSAVPAATMPGGVGASRIRVADLDNDGDPDVLAAAQGGIRYFRRAANGEYDDVTGGLLDIPTPWSSVFDLADVDADGDIDLIVGGIVLRLFVNDGTGRFLPSAPTALPPLSALEDSFRFGDFDADGDPDIAMVSLGVPRVLVNDGTGAFIDAPGLVSTGTVITGVSDLEVADIDSDGDADVLISSGVAGAAMVLRNDGAGLLVDDTANALPAGHTNGGTELADLNGDGLLDIVTNRDARLLLNSGAGVFVDAPVDHLRIQQETSSVSLGDVDSDGDVDIAVTHRDHELPVELFLNDGSARFIGAMRTRVPGSFGYGSKIAAGDIDGDGDADLVELVDETFGIVTAELRVLANDGFNDYTDITETALPFATGTAVAIEVADVSGDGVADIIAGGQNAPLRLYISNGGVFTDASSLLPSIHVNVASIAVGDVNGDGLADLFLGCSRSIPLPVYPHENRLYLQTPTGLSSIGRIRTCPASST